MRARGLFCGAMRLARGGCVRPVAVVRFYRNVLCSAHAGHAFLLECRVFDHAHHTFLSGCLMLDHACCLPHCAKQNGLRYVPFLFRRGSGSPFVRSRWPCGYRTWWVHFGLARFFRAIPTENEGTRERGERGKRSRRRGVSVLLRDHIGLAMFSAGSPLGAARPQTCAKETRLPGLSSFDSRRGCVSRGEGHSGITQTYQTPQ